MAEQKQTNIHYRLQKCRVDLQKKPMKKTGKNAYAGYEYFELKDYLPFINEICFENGINPVFVFTLEEATLILKDIENPEISIPFKTPIELVQMKGSNAMQNIRATQTYARNQLYTMAFEIAENDVVNSSEIDEEAELARKKITPIAVDTIKKLIQEAKVDQVAFLKWAKVKKVEDITNKNLNIVMQELNKKKDLIEKEQKKEEVNFL